MIDLPLTELPEVTEFLSGFRERRNPLKLPSSWRWNFEEVIGCVNAPPMAD